MSKDEGMTEKLISIKCERCEKIVARVTPEVLEDREALAYWMTQHQSSPDCVPGARA